MKNLAPLAAMLAILASCSDKTPTSIDISPNTGLLLGSEEVPLRVTVKNKSGAVIALATTLRAREWRS